MESNPKIQTFAESQRFFIERVDKDTQRVDATEVLVSLSKVASRFGLSITYVRTLLSCGGGTFTRPCPPAWDGPRNCYYRITRLDTLRKTGE